MKLNEYLAQNNITPQSFALSIGVNWSAIYRYMSGIRTPRHDVMKRIFQITQGAVTPNDFLNISDKNAGGE